MMDRRYKTLAAAAVLSVLLLPEDVGAQELIGNRTFDTGIDGWIAAGYGTGSIDWAADLGNPPGALKLIDDIEAVPQDCFPIHPGGTVTLSVDAFRQTSGDTFLCIITFSHFMTDDCTGTVFEPVNVFEGTRRTNEWEHLTFTFPEFVEITTFKPTLVKFGGDDPTTQACLFDNVSLVRNAPPTLPLTEVPTMGTAGLLVLGSLLGAAALVLLRRKRET